MTYRKKLIEIALPLETIDAESAREKNIRHGHPSTFHLWWARRPLASARAVVFASLVDDPNDPNAPTEFVEACRKLPRGRNAAENDTPRQRLFDFIEQLTLWENTTNDQILGVAKQLIELSTNGNPPQLVDPFAGGGAIPLEAQRLGLKTYAYDLNPVSVMINKAQVEIPPRFVDLSPVNPKDREGTAKGGSWKGASGLVADILYYGQLMIDHAWERIGHLYPSGPNNETVIAWVWVRTVKCPNPACGARMPLASSFWLSKKKGKKTWVEPQIDRESRRVQFSLKTGPGKPPDPPKVGRGVQFRCLVCGEMAPEEYIKSHGVDNHSAAQLIGIVTEGPSGRNYHPPNEEHQRIAQEASPEWSPNLEMSTHPQYMAPPRYGMTTFADLFTSRQLVALNALSDLVDEACKAILADAIAAGLHDDGVALQDGGNGARAYAEAVSFYLGVNVSRQVNRLSALCFWYAGRENVEPFFSRQAFTMNWNFAEANPFSNSTGNFMGQLSYLVRVLENLPARGIPGTAEQQDATMANYSPGTMFCTDPPYSVLEKTHVGTIAGAAFGNETERTAP